MSTIHHLHLLCVVDQLVWLDECQLSWLGLGFWDSNEKKKENRGNFWISGHWKVFEAMMLPLLDSNNQPVRRASVAEALFTFFTFEWAFKIESKEQDWGKAYGTRCVSLSHNSTMPFLENKVFLKALEENKVEDSGTGGTEFWDQSRRELRNAISTDVCSLQ